MMRLINAVLCSAILTSAATPLTWEKLAASVHQDPAVTNAGKRVALLANGPGRKLWDELEFRYQADGLGMLEHDFELRLVPVPMGESRANQAYWKHQKAYQGARQADDISERLYERYYHALRYLATRTVFELHTQLAAINQDRIQVLLALTGAENFNPVDLVDAQSKDAELRAELLDDQDDMRAAAQKLTSWVPGTDTVVLDMDWLPLVEDVQAMLVSHPPRVDSSYPELAKAKAKYDASRSRLDLEKAGDDAILQYVNLGYKWTIAKKEYDYENGILTDNLIRKEDNSRMIDRWSIGAGVRIPLFDSKGDDQLRRQIDMLDCESDYLAGKHDLEREVERVHEEITALLQQRAVQKDFMRQVDAGSLFKDFAVRAGTDPLLLLKARESSVQSELLARKLEFEIYYRYLELLQYSGVLARSDVANHLKVGIE